MHAIVQIFFQTLPFAALRLYLFIDSSPQHRGLELFAASFDLVIEEVKHFFQRRLMPQVSIGSVMYTCLGKAFAMLWQIWLLVGPKYIDMRICLDSVAGINTDFGTERKVVDLPDVLIDFMHFIGCPVPKNAVRETWLLPNALPIAGWHHIFDGLIRFGLYQFAWFPSWLLTLKGCLRFSVTIVWIF